MIEKKFQIPVEPEDDTSYYPGISHTSAREVELEEYIWSMHQYIDAGLIFIRLNNNIKNASATRKSYFTVFKG